LSKSWGDVIHAANVAAEKSPRYAISASRIHWSGYWGGSPNSSVGASAHRDDGAAAQPDTHRPSRSRSPAV